MTPLPLEVEMHPKTNEGESGSGASDDSLTRPVEASTNEARGEVWPTRGRCYQFPLRPDYDAQVVLPTNLTRDEALRLRDFLMALAAPSGRSTSAEDESSTSGT